MRVKKIDNIVKRKPLSKFFGVLRKESGERLEKAVAELRRKHKKYT